MFLSWFSLSAKLPSTDFPLDLQASLERQLGNLSRQIAIKADGGSREREIKGKVKTKEKKLREDQPSDKQTRRAPLILKLQ